MGLRKDIRKIDRWMDDHPWAWNLGKAAIWGLLIAIFPEAKVWRWWKAVF